MMLRAFVTLSLVLGVAPARAQDALVTYKSMSPDVALDACAGARSRIAASAASRWRSRWSDRFGVTQVVLRDRFAGPHTVPTATGKAWTAVTFRTNTTELVGVTQPGMPQAGLRSLPGAVILGGGVVVEAGGSLVGAVGVSGAPAGDADDACARAGIEAVRDKLEF